MEFSLKTMNIKEVKTVTKPWGWERWIADGKPNFSYALKEICIKAKHKSSLQFHKFKQETSYVQKGRGILYYSELPIDADKFAAGMYTNSEIQEFIKNIKTKELVPGSIFHVFPGLIHRVEAIEDLLLIESSTVELDDIFRIQDDFNRTHGRIDKEHK